jgi:cardiolipin synthase
MPRITASLVLLCSTLLFAAGCSSNSTPATAPVTTAPAPALNVSPSTTLAFPSTTISQTSATQTFTFTNTGTSTLTLGSYTQTGATTAFLQTSASTCASTTVSLAPGANCTLVFSFMPQAVGFVTETITATDNTSSPSLTLILTGTGATATVPQATLSGTGLTFNGTSTGSTSAAQTLTLSNGGNGTLTIPSIAPSGINAGVFTESDNCAGSVAAGASCTISITFSPTAASTTYTATLVVTDNAGNIAASTQIASLTGISAAPAVPVPTATLSGTAIAFPTTLVTSTSAPLSVTLTNNGNATLTITGIALGGTNPSDFTRTTTCGTTLAATASCTITATFTPAAATSYTATITLTSSAASSPQTITLSGAGTTSNVTRTLYTFPESDNSATVLYNFINSAQKTIDMTMYEMQDTTFTADLVAACARGVKVRVVFSSSEASANATALSAINTGCGAGTAVNSNSAFTNTHQKTITIDGAQSYAQTAILSLNLQTQYYSTTRDFALIENDAADIAAIETTFAQDYAAGGTNSSTEFNYIPGGGDTTAPYTSGDLIWSPTTAQASMLSLINNATKTLLVENEEMSAGNIVSALEAACTRGVTVHITMVASSSYTANFNALTAAGCGVYLYPNTNTGFYVHAKAVVADYGLATQNAYMGSINYSNASMLQNRELGLFLSDPVSVTTLYNVLTQDYTGNPVY